MKHILSSVAALALATGVGTAAHAEPFNGPFIGVQGGWSQSDAGSPSTSLGDVQIDRTRDSVVGGAFAGYDHKILQHGPFT